MSHDLKMLQSLTKEQRKWVMACFQKDAMACEVRESVACAWAFDLGRQLEEEKNRRRIVLA